MVLWDVLEGTPTMEGGWRYVEGLKGTDEMMPPVTEKTKLLIVPHTSNVLGVMMDLERVGKFARAWSPSIKIVVDGVAAAPHRYAGGNGGAQADFYVVSCHKLFGPHLGACVKRKRSEGEKGGERNTLVEKGTMNFEACNGVVGLLEYFLRLANISVKINVDEVINKLLLGESKLSDSKNLIAEAYENIELAESSPMSLLLDR